MSKSFYHYLLKYRNPSPRNPIEQFANDAYHDHSFPSRSTSYDEISRYLELNGHYLSNMTIFDQVWELFIQEEK